MKTQLMLGLAVVFAACHSRNEDQAGAAPARADTTAARADTMAGRTDTTGARADTMAGRTDTAVTHVVDPGRTGPPGVSGRPPTSNVGIDSLKVDTTKAVEDTLHGRPGQSPVSVPQDTLGPRTPSRTPTDTSGTSRAGTSTADSSTAR
jgi:hypothetical protein